MIDLRKMKMTMKFQVKANIFQIPYCGSECLHLTNISINSIIFEMYNVFGLITLFYIV